MVKHLLLARFPSTAVPRAPSYLSLIIPAVPQLWQRKLVQKTTNMLCHGVIMQSCGKRCTHT